MEFSPPRCSPDRYASAEVPVPTPRRDDGGHRPSLSKPPAVRAENLVHGSDQQGRFPPSRPAVMITGHVPAVRLLPDHAGRRVAAAVPACGDVVDRRDLDPAPSARRPAAAAAAPPEAALGGPGPARGSVRRHTGSAPSGAAATDHPGHDPALAPRHCPPPPGRQVRARQHLATLTRNQVRFTGTAVTVPMVTEPTSAQREAFDLIGAPIPLTLK